MTDNSNPSQPSHTDRERFVLPWRFLSIVGGLLAVLHIYIGLRLLPDLPIGRSLRIVGATALALSWLTILPGMMARFIFARQAVTDIVTWIGMLFMGTFAWLLVFTLIREIALGVVYLAAHSVFPSTETPSAVVVVLAAFLAMLIGFVIARHGPRIVRVEIPIAGLPDALSGFTIAQISDIHIGPTIKGDYLAAVVEKVNRLKPDLIAVTGDLVDGKVTQLAKDVAPLARLSAQHGVYFVTGNHEYYSGAAAWTAEIRQLGLRVLSNEHVVIDRDGTTLVVAGVTDYSAGGFDPALASNPAAAIAGAPSTAAARILLAHQPRSATAAAAAGFDVQLSGHTHGGQFWPWNYFVRLQQPFTAGLHRVEGLWVYVTRGTGYWGPPNRLGSPPEIALLRLASAPKESP